MKRFILTTIIAILSHCFFCGQLYSQKRVSIKVSPTYFVGNSVVFEPGTSFLNLSRQSSVLNLSNSYGLSTYMLFVERRTYYHSVESGIRISILKTTATQKLTIDPTPKSNLGDVYQVTNQFNLLQIPILCTQASTFHQIFIWEIGPVYNWRFDMDKPYPGAMFNFGIYNHINKRLSYSILVSNSYTHFSKSNYLLNNGLQLNLIYKLKK